MANADAMTAQTGATAIPRSVVLYRHGTERRPSTGALLRATMPEIELDLAQRSVVVFGPDRTRIRALPIGE